MLILYLASTLPSVKMLRWIPLKDKDTVRSALAKIRGHKLNLGTIILVSGGKALISYAK